MKTLKHDDMHGKYLLFGLAIGLIVCLPDCKQVYEPPAIKANNNYLVVDGIINIGGGSVTTINLNRTKNLSDSTSAGIPELHAQVAIVGAGGASYGLQDTGNHGIYISAALSLDNSQQYRIAVTTSDGRKYQSDLVSGKQTPPIDSITWKEPLDLTFYVTTHDPAAKTRYYRWDFIETWEHDAPLQTPWGVSNGIIFAVDSTNQKMNCWTTLNSTGVIIDNSNALGQDLVDQFPIYTVGNGSEKLGVKYSILVRQYAVTQDAYNYWNLIQKTSQGLGTLFDLQPTQLVGNIHCLTNPSEPVIGFTSASTVQEQRLFLFHTQLQNWPVNSPGGGCDTTAIPVNPNDFRIYNYPDPYFAPYYFVMLGPLVLATKTCLDCTLYGGNNIRPSYWP
jgi:Domain of unknown function (DUF4249)